MTGNSEMHYIGFLCLSSRIKLFDPAFLSPVPHLYDRPSEHFRLNWSVKESGKKNIQITTSSIASSIAERLNIVSL